MLFRLLCYIAGTRVFLSVAVDLVIQEIQEPVRFLIETKARVFPQQEKFWYFGKKILNEQFYLKLREVRHYVIGVQLTIPSKYRIHIGFC